MVIPLPRVSTVLLVVLGGVLLAAILIPTVAVCGPSKETSVTRSRISDIVTACYFYRKEYGGFPSAQDEERLWSLLGGDNPRRLRFIVPPQEGTGEFIDGWGRPLRGRMRGGVFELRSSGTDGISFTDDDWLVLLDDDALRRGVHEAREERESPRYTRSSRSTL